MGYLKCLMELLDGPSKELADDDVGEGWGDRPLLGDNEVDVGCRGHVEDRVVDGDPGEPGSLRGGKDLVAFSLLDLHELPQGGAGCELVGLGRDDEGSPRLVGREGDERAESGTACAWRRSSCG